MYTVVMVLMTILNILILMANFSNIKQFKMNQTAFINQQNVHTIAILDIKDKLEKISEI